MKGFERRFKRTEELKCSPVKHYRSLITQDEADEAESDDEVDVLWEKELYEHFGSDSSSS